ncbi:uracil-DNA glycosylase [Candidatus Microgenomates bacterium]|nr:uracil-DNA glycosylase [Candidatus Microgenomates bacterium]
MVKTKTLDKSAQLEQIAADIVTDNICPELALAATQLVVGEGDPDAEVVLIGEAPGKSEDEQGRPFVGAAGKLLTQMLEAVGLSRSAVYITNIVKYRPPENRDPLPGEVEAFMPYLMRQLAVIEPKLIVTLGRYSMNVFLPELRISQCHGQPKRKAGRVYLPLYHPAVALYNGSMRATLLEDFAKIPAILAQINKGEPSDK